MTRRGAAFGSLVFTVGEPGVMGVLVPYLLTGWDGSEPPLALQVAGVALLAAGAAVLAHTIIRFAVEGLGTPFPGAPTENLVVGGLYRYVRNPMYLAVIAIILGQAAILGSVTLAIYAAVFWAIVAGFIGFYEEPALSERYGEQYDAYRRAVRRWIPRATPWNGESPA
jgi:protein-S-isoprenylcysteine O-methyltransferase Ste14